MDRWVQHATRLAMPVYGWISRFLARVTYTVAKSRRTRRNPMALEARGESIGDDDLLNFVVNWGGFLEPIEMPAG